ncbi:MAG: FIST C-terminal domain-containing protein [Pirellulales bacterium]|nr:FIST C-terminal domain-containing protein [Pirellulales bacterium]
MSTEVRTGQLRCAAAVSTQADTASAIEEACERALAELQAPPHLALVFVSPHHGPDFAPWAARLRARLGSAHVLGCTGETIVGGALELEERPALSVWLAHLPNVDVVPMHLTFERTPEGGSIIGWPERLDGEWPDDATLLLLAEPYSFPADVLLERLDEDRPGVQVIGGMASGGFQPGQNRLFLDGEELAEGAVAVLLSGALRVRSVVSQGCRPIGRPFVITKADRNIIVELSGRPALEQLSKLYGELPTADQLLIRQGLHVGTVINEYQETFQRGDFLVRNVIGSDPASGVIAVGDYVRVGQTVQFHIRDADTADEDLRELLARAREDAPAPPRGALLFSCNGRGTRMFPEPHHDAGAIQRDLAGLPLAGFFAQGELGPIGGRNFVHGFTASVALFEDAR